jgi:hypothetical protein
LSAGKCKREEEKDDAQEHDPVSHQAYHGEGLSAVRLPEQADKPKGRTHQTERACQTIAAQQAAGSRHGAAFGITPVHPHRGTHCVTSLSNQFAWIENDGAADEARGFQPGARNIVATVEPDGKECMTGFGGSFSLPIAVSFSFTRSLSWRMRGLDAPLLGW